MTNIQVMIENDALGDDWNPMRDDYEDPNVNCYAHGPGADMDVDLQRPSVRSDSHIFKLRVRNIPAELTELGLENLFLNFGNPTKIFRSKDARWAFVEYRSLKEAQKAITELDKRPPFNMRVGFARSESEKERILLEKEKEKEFSRQIAEITKKSNINSFRTELPNSNSKFDNIRITLGRGVSRGRGLPLLQAYRQWRERRPGNLQMEWSAGNPDIQDPDGHIYDPNSWCHYPANQVQQKIYVSLSDNIRKVEMGRGFVPPPPPTNSNKHHQAVPVKIGNGMYQLGKEILVPMGNCSQCGTSTSMKCLQCGTFYCSQSCEKNDAQHTRNCVAKQSIDITFSSDSSQRSVKFGPLVPKAKPSPAAFGMAMGRPDRSVLDVLQPGKNVIFQLTSKQSDSLLGPVSCEELYEETKATAIELPEVLSQMPVDPSFRPVEGQLLGARDGRTWWRGFVLAAPDINDTYSIALCDKGSIESVHISNLRQLPLEYHGVLELCVKCTVVKSHVTQTVNELCSHLLEVDKSYTLCVEQKLDSSFTAKLMKEPGSQVLGDVLLERWNPVVEQWPLKSVPLGPTCRVILTSYHHQCALYVRPVGKIHQEKFFSLMQQVAALHVTSGPLGRAPHRGEMVACRFKDGNYYRAVVVGESTEVIGEYVVSFIDFGNVGSAPAADMKPLNGELKMHPCLAVKISLKDVPDGPLTEEAVHFFNTILEKEQELKLESKEGNKCVELFLSDGSSVNSKLRKLLKPGWKQAEEQGENLFDGFVCELKDLDVLPLVETEEENCRAQILVLDIMVDGRIAACPAYSHVLPQVVTTLSSQVNEYCEAQDSSARYNPRIEEVCLARFRDGHWYRAVNTGNVDSRRCTVFFLDYGNQEIVEHVNIRRIVKDFIRTPSLVSLCQIKDAPTEVTPDLKKFLSEHIITNRIYDVQVVKQVSKGEYIIQFPELKIPKM